MFGRILNRISVIAISFIIINCGGSTEGTGTNSKPAYQNANYSNLPLLTEAISSMPIVMTASADATCILQNGRVKCWGAIDPHKIPYLKLPRAISVNGYDFCALDVEGIKCMDHSDAIPPLVSPKEISVGVTHSCALDSEGVKCWGDNSEKQANVPPLRNPTRVAAGFYYTCAIDDRGLNCWGRVGSLMIPNVKHPTDLALGYRYVCAIDSDEVICGDLAPFAKKDIPKVISPRKIFVGDEHACVLDSEGMKCWGDNGKGQATVPKLDSPQAAVASRYHSCAIDREGIKCWGGNFAGESKILHPIVSPVTVAIGGSQTCVVDAKNRLQCWGENDPPGITDPPKMENPRSFSFGSGHICAVDDRGGRCWGNNIFSYLEPEEGLGAKSICTGLFFACLLYPDRVDCSRGFFSQMPRLPSPEAISCGQDFACALTSQGVKCWGDNNSYHQLDVPNLKSPIAISSYSGTRQTCAIDKDGVQCWGECIRKDCEVPRLVSPTQISVGGHLTCALDKEGVKCWGDCLFGSCNVPKLVSPTQISVGTQNACAIDKEGVKCWGRGTFGETNVP